MVRKRRLGVAGVVTGLLLLGVWGGPSWAEEPTDLVGPTVEPGFTDAEAPGDDPDLQKDAEGLGDVPLDQGEGEPEALTLETPPDLVAEFALSPMEAKPGGQVRFSGKCLLYGTPGDLAYLGVYWANKAENADTQKSFFMKATEINDDGTFDQLLTVPLDATPGVYDIPGPSCGLQDQDWGGEKSLGTFTVLSDAVLPTEGPPEGEYPKTNDPEVPVLAETGSGASLLLLWGAVAAGVLGVGFVARARYTRRCLNQAG